MLCKIFYGVELVTDAVDSWGSLMEKGPLHKGFKAIQQKPPP